ncbi:hypothetical protein OSB04_001558 [Centaurea solstitialis]|uniref:Peptidase M16 C-terminal domain-containing protein n=1 Tax=Centaurea solstitialis TaxID=347529 RepID=A0AA38WLJ1_9ASTR|nr:hypothetical protein OSB04_001558 [Centaurea solstitialis]
MSFILGILHTGFFVWFLKLLHNSHLHLIPFIGNWDTLEVRPKARGVDTRDELLKFYKENYSANLMNLVVYAKESLDKIESRVLSTFNEIRNIDRIHPSFPGQPCTSEHLQHLVHLHGFPLLVKIARLPNPVAGWATSLYAFESDWNVEFSFFDVVIDLSDAGHDLDVICNICFMKHMVGLSGVST